MDQEPAVVVHDQEEVSWFAARSAWMRHKRADQHVADPALVGPFGFESTEGPRLTSWRSAVQPTPRQVLKDGALGNAHAMPRHEHRGDLGYPLLGGREGDGKDHHRTVCAHRPRRIHSRDVSRPRSHRQ
jgi:hypothetical protein